MASPENVVSYQGQGVVPADLLNTFVQWVPDVVTLRGFIGIDQMGVYLQGLAVAGDGGQGSFYWSSTATAPDDGQDVIVPSGAALGAWLRIPNITGPADSVTQKQMRGWLAANGSPLYIYTVDAACPADIADTVNIEWLHGDSMVLGDTLYVFIQSTLGFTADDMAAAFAAMQAYPQ